MRKLVLMVACATACCLAAAGDEAPADVKVTSAAEIQVMFYEGLIERGVPAALAALLTADTQILSEDDNHIRFVQTMIGEGKREVEIAFRAAEPGTAERVAMTLDDGSLVLAESIDVTGPADRYKTNIAVFIPAESVPPELQKQPDLGQDRSGWLDWIGIRHALAQAPGSGLTATFSDTFSSSAPTSTSGSGMQSLVQAAEKAISDQTSEFVKTAQDVASAIKPKVEGPKTLLQHRLDLVKAGAKVLEHGGKVYKSLKEDDAMRQRLRALKDCAENPTEPTARDARKNDPNYRRATTEAIEDAERNLKLNTTIRIVASTGNAIASVLLGSTKSKPVSLLGKIEDKMLQHVAEEYIMKDAGKGVVPCKPDCGPVYSPAPPTEQEASYPPAEMSCEQPQPEQLACAAAPASTSSGSSSAGYTPGPSRPATPPPAETCGVLTQAQFTYTYSLVNSGCSLLGCSTETEERFYTGSAALRPNGTAGYQGRGTGDYREVRHMEATGPVPCSWSRSSGQTVGSADLVVNAYFSINNSGTGGYETSEMPEDTSVVEFITEGEGLYDEEHSSSACDPPSSRDGNTGAVGFDCHFYGVDLYRPGFYQTHKDGQPQSGICTLSLLR
jgi:hypothetical protein